MPVKRGPGRPRKHPLPTPTDPLTQTQFGGDRSIEAISLEVKQLITVRQAEARAYLDRLDGLLKALDDHLLLG